MAEYNVEINKYNGDTAEYDPLYPVTKGQNISDKGQPNSVAPLDENGKVPSANLPEIPKPDTYTKTEQDEIQTEMDALIVDQEYRLSLLELDV